MPVEYAISLPLPTLRAGQPGYAFFASPAVRRPGAPMQQGAPDRWWVSDARNGQTLLFAHCKAQPFAPDTSFNTETLPVPTLGLAEMLATMARLTQQVTAIAPHFFTGDPGDPTSRAQTRDALLAVIPAPLLPQYRALVPDFMKWLDA